MLEGADKMLMEHRDRQLAWAVERIAALEAEVASLHNAQQPQPAKCYIPNGCTCALRGRNNVCCSDSSCRWRK